MQDGSPEFCLQVDQRTPLNDQAKDDQVKTKEQLMSELASLRQQVAELKLQNDAAATHVLERITDGFFVVDRQWCVVYLNACTETLIRRSRHDVLGKNLWQEYPALVGTLIEQKYREALATNRAVHFEAFDPAFERWWEIYAYPDATGLSVFFRDIDDRKQAEAQQQLLLTELTAWQSRYEVVGQVSNQMLYEWEIQADRATWGANTEQILGYSRAEMPKNSQSWLDLIHPIDRPAVQRRVDQRLRDCVPFQVEYRLRHKQGHYIWVAEKCQFVTHEAGAFDRVIGFIADISERKQAEQSLRENAEIFRQIAENIREVFFICALDYSQVFYISPAYEQIWGRSCDSLYRHPTSWLDAVHPEDRNRVVVGLERQPQGQPFCQEYRIIRPDGSIRWIFDRATLIRDQNGRFYRVTGIAEDVTERRHVEQGLREVVEFNQQLIANLQDGVIVYGRNFQYLLWNRAMEQMSGLRADAVLGKRPIEVFPFLEETGIHRMLRRALAGETVIAPDTYFQVPETGKSGWTTAKFSPFHDTQGSTIGVIAIVHDITHRKQAELALEHRIQFDRLLAQLSIQFLNLKSDQIDASIQQGLQAIGEFLAVDWVWIYLYSEEGTVATKAYEWLAAGITSPLGQVRTVPIDVFSWSIGKMRQGQPLYVSSLADLPPEAAIERESAQSIGTQSFLAVPLTHQGKLIGSMGFHTFRSPKHCSAEDLNLLATLGTLFASKILCKRSQTSNRAIIRAIPDLLIRFSRAGVYLELVNQGNIKLFRPVADCIGSSIYDVLPLPLAEQRMYYLNQAFETGEVQVYEQQIAVDGEIRYEEARIVVSGEEDALLIVRDITDRKRAEQELHRLADLDSLTQVANRRRFDEYLNLQWYQLRRNQFPLTLILCDVDQFKPYNDHYGHQAGDDCLRQVAQAIQRSTRRSIDLVARYGGDEFALILPNTDVEGAVQVARSIQTEIAQLCLLHSYSQVSPHITTSIGIASTVPTQTTVLQDLITAADRALYQAKAMGRDRYCVRPL